MVPRHLKPILAAHGGLIVEQEVSMSSHPAGLKHAIQRVFVPVEYVWFRSRAYF